MALIRLTSIAPCQELLDMQEKVGGKKRKETKEFVKLILKEDAAATPVTDAAASAAGITTVAVAYRRASWRW